MTGEELAITLRGRQGYLLVAVNRRCDVGFMLPQGAEMDGSQKTHAIRLLIAGDATVAEFRAQLELIRDLIGRPVELPPAAYFYRVEAAD